MKKLDLLNPKNDYVFKRIFGHKGNEKITKAFLEDITKTKINKIELIEDANLGRDLTDDKIGVLDVKAVIDNNIQADIEMQIAKNKDIISRILFYWSKMYISTVHKGEKYDKLKRTIIILIADFNLEELKETKRYLTKWQLKDENEAKLVLTKDIEIYIIELPKYKNTHNDKLDNWIQFIKNYENMEEFEMEKEVKEAYECLKEISSDEHERRLAELRHKYIWEMNSAKEYGKDENKKEVARRMLDLNLDIELIMKVTELTKDEIEELK